MTQLIRKLPDILDGTLAWANDAFSMTLSRDEILDSVTLTPDRLAEATGSIGISLLGFVGSTLGAVFSAFTFGMFIFCISANMPQLEERVARAEYSGRPRSARRRSGTTPGAEADPPRDSGPLPPTAAAPG